MLHWIDYAMVALYLMGVLGLGIYLRARATSSIESYFLGDRELPWWALGASGMASNTDIAGTMVIAALIYSIGLQAFFIELRGGVVLVMAFFMVFMGKWTRRAQVMTLAEWMRLRFGESKQGKLAQFISAVANLVISIWILSYFAVGGGKFIGEILQIPDRWASIILIGFALIYTLMSGFHGVIWTDVVQGVFIFVAIIYLCGLAFVTVTLPEQFMVSLPLKEGFQSMSTTPTQWGQWWPSSSLNLPGQYSAYNLLGMTALFYFLKTCIEGFGGAGGYMSQRYLAAKSDRDAGLLSLFWIALMSFRWPLVTAVALLGIHYGMTQGVIADPELVLPVVLSHYVPVGIKGILVACFIAAAMSTFDSIINASAAFWVKDIYQGFINPEATPKQLMSHSYGASILVVVAGVLLSFPVININDIWGWITLAFGTGVFVPLLLRWYWWRFNGYGFAWGTVTGMVSAIVIKYFGFVLPEYQNFLVPACLAFTACILATYLTPPIDKETLTHFYETTRPFGFWKPISQNLSADLKADIALENRQDMLALCFAIPWQMVLFLMGMVFMSKQWGAFGSLFLTWVLLSWGLYTFWFRPLQATSGPSKIQ